MTPKQALAKLQKVYGPNAAYRLNRTPSDADERNAAKAALSGAFARRNELSEQRKARAEFLLGTDAEYQRLKAEETAARIRHDELRAQAHYYRITVGIQSDVFFHVKAEGDTWADVFAQIGGGS